MPFKNKEDRNRYQRKTGKMRRANPKYKAAIKRWREQNPDWWKKWSKNNKDKLHTYMVTWRRKNRVKFVAHGKVSEAIKSGKLKRNVCSVCGNKKSEAHHEDYSKPLEVVWLCKKHHVIADGIRRERLKKTPEISEV